MISSSCDACCAGGSAAVADSCDHRLPRLSSEFYLLGEPVTPVFIDKVLNKINSNNNITALVVPSSKGIYICEFGVNSLRNSQDIV